ncbi:choice-of-anchor D domain-containing protein [Nevskia soli]|uniref:choice-of-anchor D domain-containing protein n=1 Tax=Nevskia soli TaxID=418856 RepID=UPI00056B0CC9|nr:choice-of-anchor D domain-containing protein [Nevskia soli]
MALVVVAALSAPSAWAASAANGKLLYNNTPGGGGTSCANGSCHGPDPTQNNNNIQRGANNPTVIQNAINNGKGGMGIYQGTLSASDIADIAAYIGNPAAANGPNAAVSPAALSFPSTAVGASSASQTVTLSNTGGAVLSISSIAASVADFKVAGGTCAAAGSVAAGGSCSVLVTFSPASSGSRTGSLTIAHNAPNSPSSVGLSGTGTAAQATISLSASSLTFAAQAVGSSSAAQSVTVRNSGAAALNFSAITVGGSNAADFSRGGSCAVGTAVAAGGSCTLSITFTPQAAGSRIASVSLASNASNGAQTLNLSGSGSAVQPAASASPLSLSFGSVVVGQQSVAQTVTVSNGGNAALQLAAIATNSADFAVSGGSCAVGTPVAAGGSCTVLLKFQPQATGSRSGTLSITHNAAGSPSTVALSGSGTAATPVAQLAPATLNFSETVGTPSAAQTVILSNTGTAPLALSAVALGGADAADYTIASGSTCAASGSVAINASCIVKIVFTPGAQGARAAALSITHDAAGSPSQVTLNGTGTAVPMPQLSVNAVSLSFPAQAINTSSAAKTLTVSNSGSATLSFSTIGIGGADAGDFAIVPSSGDCAVGGSLAVGASCAINLGFRPTVSSGTRSAGLNIGSNAGNSNVTVSLSGIAAPPAAPAVVFAPASLDLGSETVGVTSAAASATLRNTGSAPLAISGLSAGPAQFTLLHNCPASLAAAASCTLQLSFTPSTVGVLNGTVTLLSNAATSPDSLALTGTGVQALAPRLGWTSGNSMSFPDTSVGTPSTARSISLSNLGNAPAAIQQLQIAGADAADFALDPSGTCAAGGSLAAGSACTIAVVFSPGAAGLRSANLNVVSNATGLTPASLSGNGVAGGAPALSLSPTAIYLTGPTNAPLQPQALVLTNSGAGVLQVTKVAAAAPLQVMDASTPGGGTCPPAPFSLQPGSSCTLMVGASGPVNTQQLQISSNAGAAPSVVSVSGTPLTNAGAGGCSIAPPDRPGDPLWAVMLAAAALALWRRRGAEFPSRIQRKFPLDR